MTKARPRVPNAEVRYGDRLVSPAVATNDTTKRERREVSAETEERERKMDASNSPLHPRTLLLKGRTRVSLRLTRATTVGAARRSRLPVIT